LIVEETIIADYVIKNKKRYKFK